MQKHSAKNGIVGGLFFTVRSCFIGCVVRRSKRLAYTQIYLGLHVSYCQPVKLNVYMH